MLVSTEEQLGVLRARDVLRVVLRFCPGLGDFGWETDGVRLGTE
jgi:hypothetical protein